MTGPPRLLQECRIVDDRAVAGKWAGKWMEWDGPAWAQRGRLVSGLVLFAFVATHLLNHAAGLVSLAAAEQGRIWFLAVWRGVPGEWLLIGATALHVALTLARIVQRRTLRIPRWELLQVLLGLLVPPFLVLHVLGTGGLARCCGMVDSYAYYVTELWPGAVVNQGWLTAIAWAHGCIGVHFRFRLEPWYRQAQGPLTALATLLPALAFAGYVAMAREAAGWDPGLLAAVASAQGWLDQEARSWVLPLADRLEIAWLAIVVAAVGAQLVRKVGRETADAVRIRYPGGRAVRLPRGGTVLEASRANGIAHAAVCGGRGRCSTCRVRVGQGIEALLPPGVEETRVLRRIGAGPGVRLACQLRPTADLAVTPLLPPGAGATAANAPMDPHQGMEREIVVIFADLRGFTRLSERRLPYDVVFLLNRWFQAMGEAVEAEGGHLDKFVGDGLIALFGIEGELQAAAAAAMRAAMRMRDAMAQLNADLADDLKEPLRIGIGMHAGPAIVGDMGWGRAVALTAIGDTMNVASRLEQLTKDLEVELVVSARVAELAGWSDPAAVPHEVEIRGRRGSLDVLALQRREPALTREA